MIWPNLQAWQLAIPSAIQLIIRLHRDNRGETEEPQSCTQQPTAPPMSWCWDNICSCAVLLWAHTTESRALARLFGNPRVWLMLWEKYQNSPLLKHQENALLPRRTHQLDTPLCGEGEFFRGFYSLPRGLLSLICQIIHPGHLLSCCGPRTSGYMAGELQKMLL